jgi:hypothetical protein
MKKHVVFEKKDGTVRVEEREVLVGSKFSAVMPDGGGKRAEVVPTASVFDNLSLARAAATKGGKVGWVVCRHKGVGQVVKGRVILRCRGANYGWKLIIQPVTESRSIRCGEPFEVSDMNSLFFTKKMEALEYVAENLAHREREAKENLSEAQVKVRELSKVRKLLGEYKVKIPTEKQIQARSARRRKARLRALTL